MPVFVEKKNQIPEKDDNAMKKDMNQDGITAKDSEQLQNQIYGSVFIKDFNVFFVFLKENWLHFLKN